MEDAPLTRSGAGRRVSPDLLEDSAALGDALAEHGFLVVHHGATNADDVRTILARLGEPVQHASRQEGVLELDGDRDETEVLRGREMMPLHKDGLLMGVDVAVVGIHCQVWRGVENGRTLVSDARSAWDAMDPEVLQLLERQGIEARAADEGYYLEGRGTWHPIEAIQRRPTGVSLAVGLPFPKGARASWHVRVAGVDSAASNAVFEHLEEVLLREEYVYRHEWAEGDLLLLNNHNVLHGREAFRGERALNNLQAS